MEQKAFLMWVLCVDQKFDKAHELYKKLIEKEFVNADGGVPVSIAKSSKA
jgi:hypothetical protein